jgi:Immunity protein Imm1
MMTLRWSDEDMAEVPNVAALKELLDGILRDADSGEPRFIELHNPPHGYMHLGVGASYTVLSYMAEEDTGPYFVTVAKSGRLDGVPDLVEFDYGGDASEFPGSSAVPLRDGVAAFLEFAETGERSASVGWQPV